MLDQRAKWVGTDGYEYRIDELPEDKVIYNLDYALANASMLREAWGFAKKENYDVNERARRWMLQRPAIRALMLALIEIEEEQEEWDE